MGEHRSGDRRGRVGRDGLGARVGSRDHGRSPAWREPPGRGRSDLGRPRHRGRRRDGFESPMSASIRLVELVGRTDRDERPVDRRPGGVEVDVAPFAGRGSRCGASRWGGQAEGGEAGLRRRVAGTWRAVRRSRREAQEAACRAASARQRQRRRILPHGAQRKVHSACTAKEPGADAVLTVLIWPPSTRSSVADGSCSRLADRGFRPFLPRRCSVIVGGSR